MKLTSVFEWIKKKVTTFSGTESQQPAKTQASANYEPYVYVTAKGKKFHWDLLCPCIRNAKEIKMSLSKARKAGYTACDKCCYEYLHK